MTYSVTSFGPITSSEGSSTNPISKMAIHHPYLQSSSILSHIFKDNRCVCCLLSSVQLSVTPGLYPARLLCPRYFLGKNTGVGCHALLQEISPTQGSHPHLLHLLHCRWILYHWATLEAITWNHYLTPNYISVYRFVACLLQLERKFSKLRVPILLTVVSTTKLSI